ncbi:hypothetical protein HID58_037894 [Brassica napus]|uniref:Uncharacterized protein n=1 Tax=Brassica napus TaxID=3708 RepID=A0ABQ8BNG0_BRANA|nr:hypothetical protein HID58_037894 [Brassica napus]
MLQLPRSAYRWKIIGRHWEPILEFILLLRKLPLDRRQVNFLVSLTILLHSSLWSKCVFSHFLHLLLEAAKMMSAKNGSASRNTSGDEVIITGSRRAKMVKPEPTSSSQGKKSKGGGVTTRSAHQSAGAARSAGDLSVALANLNSKVFPQGGVVLPAVDPSEVVQVLQGGLLQLYHLKERLSNENLVIDHLRRQVSEEREREQRTARELEICDLKDKVRELEKVSETSSANALAASQKSHELEEEVETLKLEMVMAVNGARIVARWELMREWLNKQSGQWDLNRALDQYKMRLETREIRLLPSKMNLLFRQLSEMDVDSLAFPRMMSLGVVLNVERVSPFIVWGIVHRGSNTPSGFSTSFLPGLIGFSSDLWVLSLLGSYTDSYFFWDLGRGGGGGFRDLLPPLERPRCRRGFRIPLTGSGILSEEDWYPEWSFTGKMRYLILLLGTPYLAGGFGVPRYLTICGDDTCGPSPSPSWGMMLLWAEPAGAYEFSIDPRP